MKANELMIGDWVLFDHNPVRVAILVAAQDYLGLAAGNNGFGQQYCMIEPIPLTGEILEKNGFTHSFGDSDYYDYEKWEKKVNDKTIRVIKDHNGWFCRVDDIELTRSMGIAPDVHTMQHIIRIGGIEKEIIL